MNDAVAIRGLRHQYRPELPWVLDGVDLSIHPGESFGLVGPDGAGKTTLIRLLCGLLEASEGRIDVFGRSLSADIEAVKPRIGYVSQRFSLYGDLTIAENLDFFADIHGVRGSEARERKESLLEFTRLAPFRNRLADRLSGGMRQKLSLICTLVHEPELLLLDEPTTGVDPITRRDFWSILSALLDRGLTIVMSTPYLDEAERCTRVALMDQGRGGAVWGPRPGGGGRGWAAPGRLREESPLQVLEVVCSPVRRAGELLEGAEGVAGVHSFGDRLHVLLSTDVAADHASHRLSALLTAGGVQVHAARPVTAGLEDVFIDLVKEAS